MDHTDLDLLEGLLLTAVDHQLAADDVPWEVDRLGLVELDEKISQAAHDFYNSIKIFHFEK